MPELEAVATAGELTPPVTPPLPPLAVRLIVPVVTVPVSVDAVPAPPAPSVVTRPAPTVPSVQVNTVPEAQETVCVMYGPDPPPVPRPLALSREPPPPTPQNSILTDVVLAGAVSLPDALNGPLMSVGLSGGQRLHLRVSQRVVVVLERLDMAVEEQAGARL